MLINKGLDAVCLQVSAKRLEWQVVLGFKAGFFQAAGIVLIAHQGM